MATNRRDWLRQASLATLAWSLPVSGIARNREEIPWTATEEKLIQLGSNENPYGISPRSKQAILDLIGLSNRYAFNIPSLDSFTKEIAAYFGIGEESVIATAGSTRALQLLPRYYSGGPLVTAKPTFGTLPRTARAIGTRVIEIPLTEDMLHDLPALEAAVSQDTRMVYLVNPANPSATVLNPEALRGFCERVSKKTTVIVDEAYIDFPDEPMNHSLIQLAASNPRLIVLRTFSKIHGMAGLRIGFLVSHPSLTRSLRKSYFDGTQFCISTLSMTAAMASLHDEAHRASCREKNKAAREFTRESLERLNYRCVPSATNFMLFSLEGHPGDFEGFMQKNRIILHAGNFDTNRSWCRVSIGTMEEMKTFISQVERFA